MDNFLRQTAAHSAAAAGGPESQHPPVLSGHHTGRLLGVGGSAQVWFVEDRRTGAPGALKVPAVPGTGRRAAANGCKEDAEGGEEQVARLLREAAVLEALDHPHLLGIRDVVSTDRGPAILMDYAAGGSLLNLVTTRGRLSVGECITVLAPIAQALAYLHFASVQHGDVSPGNVLFTAEGKPLLADLGVGRLLGEAGVKAHGTAGFSTELQGSGLSAGFASDVYSAAAIGWYSLTGTPPGRSRDRVPLTLLVPDVPVELVHILEAALHDDAKERPSAGELADAVLRSGPPRPLDLVAAVHPSVLPELLTRPATDGEGQGSGRRPRAAIGRLWPGQRRQGQLARSRRMEPKPKRKPKPEPKARRLGRGRRSAGKRRWGGSTARFALAGLLALCGALLIGPHGPSAVGIGTSAAPAAVQDSRDTGEQGAPLEPTQPHPDASGEGEDASAHRPSLSTGMRQRLADEDPVRALSALVAVRAMVLTSGEAGLLSHVNVADSEAMAADREIVAELRAQGHVFSGLSIRVQEPALTNSVTVPEGGAAIAATAIMSGYTELDDSGVAVREVAKATPQHLVFVLVKEQGVWKIERVHNDETV